MMKKSIAFIAFLTLLINSFVPSTLASGSVFEPILKRNVWNYEGYKVSKVELDEKQYFHSRENLLFTTKLDDPKTTMILNQSMISNISNVDPKVISKTQQIAHDGFTYVEMLSNPKDGFEVKTIDQQTQSVSLRDKVMFSTLDHSLTSSVSNDQEIWFTTLDSSSKNGVIRSIISQKRKTDSVVNRNIFSNFTEPNQELLDLRGEFLLVKTTYSGGFTQLWLLNTKNKTIKLIPETWTIPPAEILYAHFLNDQTLGFFRNYTWYSYQHQTENAPKSSEIHLSWNIDKEKNVKINGVRTAFVNEFGELYVADPSGIVSFGKAYADTVYLGDLVISFQNEKGVHTYDFSENYWRKQLYRITSAQSGLETGVDLDGNIWVRKQDSVHSVKVGFGKHPMITDSKNVIWKGKTEGWYQLTIDENSNIWNEKWVAVKSKNNSAVYYVASNNLWLIPDEQTFFTWYKSWDEVRVISEQEMFRYFAQKQFKGPLPLNDY